MSMLVSVGHYAVVFFCSTETGWRVAWEFQGEELEGGKLDWHQLISFPL